MFLELLTGLLVARPGLTVVAQARNFVAAVEACGRWKPDLLLLDLHLPDGDGLGVARAYLKARPDGRVLVLSGHAANFVCPTWLSDHVQAVVSKNATFDVLRRELDVLIGGIPPSPSAPAVPCREDLHLLSDREAEVYALIGEGLSTVEIAEQLGVSQHTIHTYRKRIALKLGTQGVELARRAMAHRLSLSPPGE